MDTWFYYDVLHRLHGYMNPVSAAAVDEAAALLRLSPGSRVLDVASGNGELLVTLAGKHGISGVGVDVSPFGWRRSMEKKARRAPDADLRFLNVRGEDYVPEAPFDVACCVGASWIWHGYEGTLRALAGFVRPGGMILLGEPFWRKSPPLAYLESEGFLEEMFTDLAGLRRTAEGLGLVTIWMQAGEQADWDRYEMLQLASLDDFIREQPNHPDLDEIRGRLLPGKEAYLRFGRDCLGFALWVFRTPTSPST